MLVLLVVLVWLPVKNWPIGQAIYAIGSSQSAARMSGVNVKRTKLIAYALSGMLAALAGLILTGQTGSGDPTQGAAYTLNSIAATVIGGTSFAGGVGGPIGSIAGAYVFAIIPSVLFAARVSPFMKEFLQGGDPGPDHRHRRRSRPPAEESSQHSALGRSSSNVEFRAPATVWAREMMPMQRAIDSSTSGPWLTRTYRALDPNHKTAGIAYFFVFVLIVIGGLLGAPVSLARRACCSSSSWRQSWA